MATLDFLVKFLPKGQSGGGSSTGGGAGASASAGDAGVSALSASTGDFAIIALIVAAILVISIWFLYAYYKKRQMAFSTMAHAKSSDATFLGAVKQNSKTCAIFAIIAVFFLCAAFLFGGLKNAVAGSTVEDISSTDVEYYYDDAKNSWAVDLASLVNENLDASDAKITSIHIEKNMEADDNNITWQIGTDIDHPWYNNYVIASADASGIDCPFPNNSSDDPLLVYAYSDELTNEICDSLAGQTLFTITANIESLGLYKSQAIDSLDSTRTSAIAEINEMPLLDENQKNEYIQEINNEYDRGVSNINKAQNQADIEVALNDSEKAFQDVVDRAKLQEIKKEAKYTLEGSATSAISQIDNLEKLSSESKQAYIDQVGQEFNSGSTNIDNAISIDGVNTELNNAKAGIDDIVNQAKAEEELIEAKESAKNELESCETSAVKLISMLSIFDKWTPISRVEFIVDISNLHINDCQTIEEVNSIKQNAISSIVEICKESTKESIDAVESLFISLIENMEGLTEEQQDYFKEEISKSAKKSKENVDACTTIDDVWAANDTAITDFNVILGKARETVENNKKEAAKKTVVSLRDSAIEEIKSFSGLYDDDIKRESNKIDEKKEAAFQAIEDASTDEEINEAIDKFSSDARQIIDDANVLSDAKISARNLIRSTYDTTNAAIISSTLEIQKKSELSEELLNNYNTSIQELTNADSVDVSLKSVKVIKEAATSILTDNPSIFENYKSCAKRSLESNLASNTEVIKNLENLSSEEKDNAIKTLADKIEAAQQTIDACQDVAQLSDIDNAVYNCQTQNFGIVKDVSKKDIENKTTKSIDEINKIAGLSTQDKEDATNDIKKKATDAKASIDALNSDSTPTERLSEISSDFSYSATSFLLTKNSLGQEKINAITSINLRAEQYIKVIKNASTITDDEKQEAISTIQKAQKDSLDAVDDAKTISDVNDACHNMNLECNYFIDIHDLVDDLKESYVQEVQKMQNDSLNALGNLSYLSTEEKDVAKQKIIAEYQIAKENIEIGCSAYGITSDLYTTKDQIVGIVREAACLCVDKVETDSANKVEKELTGLSEKDRSRYVLDLSNKSSSNKAIIAETVDFNEIVNNANVYVTESSNTIVDAEVINDTKVNARNQISKHYATSKEAIQTSTDLTEEQKKYALDTLDSQFATCLLAIDDSTSASVTASQVTVFDYTLNSIVAIDTKGGVLEKFMTSVSFDSLAVRLNIDSKIQDLQTNGYLTETQVKEIESKMETASNNFIAALEKAKNVSDVVTAQNTLNLAYSDIVKDSCKTAAANIASAASNSINSLANLSNDVKDVYVGEINSYKSACDDSINNSYSTDRSFNNINQYADLAKNVVSTATDLNEKVKSAKEKIVSLQFASKSSIDENKNLTDSKKTEYKDAIDNEAKSSIYYLASATNSYDIDSIVALALENFNTIIANAKACDDESYWTVKFEMGGHGQAPEDQQKKYGETVDMPDQPSAEGYEFKGWFKDSGLTLPWSFETDKVGDIVSSDCVATIYAKWEGIVDAYAYLTRDADDNATMHFVYDDQSDKREDPVYRLNNFTTDKQIEEGIYDYPGWINKTGSEVSAEQFQYVDFESSFASYQPETMSTWFSSQNDLRLDENSFKNLNVSSCKDMSSLFEQSTITSFSFDMFTHKAGKLERFAQVFSNCVNLTSVDLNNVELINLTSSHSIDYLFWKCTSLTSIKCDQNLSKYAEAQKQKDISVFYNCGSLIGGSGTPYSGDHIDAEYARPDEGSSSAAPGYFTKSKPEDFKGLTFTAQEANSEVSYTNHGENKPNVLYSTDCIQWDQWAVDASVTLNSVGDKLYIKGTNSDGFSTSEENYSNFNMSGKIAASGNITSLIDKTCQHTYTPQFCYYGLFDVCASLITPPELPATSLATSCYDSMFWGCTSLEFAPQLNATTLADYCYYGMFSGCTSLKEAPQLGASELATSCYCAMFKNCSSLKQAPELNANVLKPNCYASMFSNCTSLEKAPELASTSLDYACCYNMFSGCTSLKEAPQLSATTLADYCYEDMFSGCSSLELAPQLSAEITSEGCCVDMFNGCTSLKEVPELKATTLATYCYYEMFANCTSLERAPQLDATTLADYCYYAMFSGCTSLKEAPQLNASQLAKACCCGMFANCSSLKQAPELNAKELTTNCYASMFVNCASLEEAPELQATTIDYACYYNMFSGCTSLKEAPQLSATTLDDYCYENMFYGCTSLQKTPELPATALADYCYCEMFAGCTSLVEAPQLQAETLSTRCYESMFKDCTSLKNASQIGASTLAEYSCLTMFAGCTSLESTPQLSANTMYKCCYAGMFNGCTSLKEVPELPATTLATYCYYCMFAGCTSLVEAPQLHATILADYCCYGMFANCTSLELAPQLGAETMCECCYGDMFQGCISLKKAPELPSRTLAPYCYFEMFLNCNFLAEAPQLNANVLYDACYANMFQNCTSLKKAPELPAATLAAHCYYQMFTGCTLLRVNDENKGVKFLHFETSAEDAVTDMFKDTGGTFTSDPEPGAIYCYESESPSVYEVSASIDDPAHGSVSPSGEAILEIVAGTTYTVSEDGNLITIGATEGAPTICYDSGTTGFILEKWQYSIDNGENWSDLPKDDSQRVINANTKFKAITKSSSVESNVILNKNTEGENPEKALDSYYDGSKSQNNSVETKVEDDNLHTETIDEVTDPADLSTVKPSDACVD